MDEPRQLRPVTFYDKDKPIQFGEGKDLRAVYNDLPSDVVRQPQVPDQPTAGVIMGPDGVLPLTGDGSPVDVPLPATEGKSVADFYRPNLTEEVIPTIDGGVAQVQERVKQEGEPDFASDAPVDVLDVSVEGDAEGELDDAGLEIAEGDDEVPPIETPPAPKSKK